MAEHRVPDALEVQVISSTSQLRLRKWIDYFEKLSPRIKLVKAGDSVFKHYYLLAERAAYDSILVEADMIIDWPVSEEVAFIVYIDSSHSGHRPKVLPRDTYVFCFGNKAFSLTHFGWEESARSTESLFSLGSFSEDTLSWRFISERIGDKIEEIEESVPIPPEQ